jgi:hypothetical protein
LGITATATAIAIATAVIAVGLSLAVSFAFKALGIGSVPSAKGTVGPPQVFRQSITNSFIVYGKRRVGGLLVFFHAKQVRLRSLPLFRRRGRRPPLPGRRELDAERRGRDGRRRRQGHQRQICQRRLAVVSARVGQRDGQRDLRFRVRRQLDDAHKGNGVAAIYAKFKLTDDVVQAGMPNITAVIEGRDEILDRARLDGYSATPR